MKSITKSDKSSTRLCYFMLAERNTQEETQIAGRSGKIISTSKGYYYRFSTYIYSRAIIGLIYHINRMHMFRRIIKLIKSGKFTIRYIKSYFNWKIVDAIDRINDYRTTGIDLTHTIPSPYYDPIKRIGMTNSQPTHYLILEKVFSYIEITDNDRFIDIGCGQGRVLAYLIKEGINCRISGVELSQVPLRTVEKWTKRYPEISIIAGDAFKLDYNQYTVLFLSQPFYPITFLKFVELLEEQLFHKISLIYLFDQESGDILDNRPGWELQHREHIFRIKSLQVVSRTRRFSVWTFDPKYLLNQLRVDKAGE